MRTYTRLILCFIVVLFSVRLAPQSEAWSQIPPPDAAWTANAEIAPIKKVTDVSLGAAQGVVIRDRKIYAYGDVYTSIPRMGVIREYDLDLKPTGREVWLKQNDKPLIIHPTGLTWDEKFGTFLGDTVQKKAMIYRIDWDLAWKEGRLDHAVLDVIVDDAAINGCRPTFVKLDDKALLATADYGDVHPEIRLYDPEKLLKEHRSSAPGAVVLHILCSPWNQNLHWDAERGRLTCVQNVIEGRGWRIQTIDLAKAAADGRWNAPGVLLHNYTFLPHDELEGWFPYDEKSDLWVTSSRRDNITIGTIKPTEEKTTPAGTR